MSAMREVGDVLVFYICLLTFYTCMAFIFVSLTWHIGYRLGKLPRLFYITWIMRWWERSR